MCRLVLPTAGRQGAKEAAIAEHDKLRSATECAPDNFCVVYGYVDDHRGVSIVMKKYDGTLLDVPHRVHSRLRF